MLGGVLRWRTSPKKGFVGAGQGACFFSGHGGPLHLALCFAFQFGPIILAFRVLVDFMAAPHTFREKVIQTWVSKLGKKEIL